MAGNIGEISVKVNVVDIAETIRGLKAIQREAKKSTQALRDLESALNGRELTYEQRLEAAGSIDLRDNHRIVTHANGFQSVVPIDPTKLFKATQEVLND